MSDSPTPDVSLREKLTPSASVIPTPQERFDGVMRALAMHAPTDTPTVCGAARNLLRDLLTERDSLRSRVERAEADSKALKDAIREFGSKLTADIEIRGNPIRVMAMIEAQKSMNILATPEAPNAL